jgi:hypothetical protein
MPDWITAGRTRGIELTEAQAQRLDTLDRAMRLLSAMVDWKEEPLPVVQLGEPGSDNEETGTR